MMSFKDFCPYTIDLDEFKDARAMFTLDEWVDIVLGAVDYNPKGYLYVNGEKYIEPYINDEYRSGPLNSFKAYTVPEGKSGSV